MTRGIAFWAFMAIASVAGLVADHKKISRICVSLLKVSHDFEQPVRDRL
jgi:hypothetical protein